MLPAPRPWYDKDGPLLLLLAVVTILVFSLACVGDFVFWDDNLNVSKNPFLNPPTLKSLTYFWKNPFLSLYIPVTYTVWIALAAVAHLQTPDPNGIQLNPWVFHTANLIIHLMAVMIVYALLRRLIGKRWPAAAGALLFAIHPLQVEPVAWVTGMKDVLCGALSLAAIWQYVSYAQSSSQSPAPARRWGHYAAAIVLFLLAVLSKPLAVVIPAAALVLDLLVLRRPWKRTVLGILPMAILALIGMKLSIQFQSVSQPADGGHLLLRPLIATDALAFYLYKLLCPAWLAFHYDRAPLTVIHAGWLFYTWLAPAAVLVVALAFRKRMPWLLPAAALFLIGVAPVLGLVPFAFQRYATVADRYVYLSMLGPAFALGAALAAWSAKAADKTESSDGIPRGALIALGLVLTLLGVRSFMQTLTWRDDASLFSNALNVNPRSFAAYDGMAGEISTQRIPGETRDAAMARLDLARNYAQRAIDLSPDNPDGYITLGSICQKIDDMPRATDAFRKAVEVAPDNAEALNLLGAALAAKGHRDEAEKYLRRAISINPSLAQAHLNLGMLRQEQGRLDEALAETRLAVGLDTGNAQARINYAMLLYFHGERDAALAQLKAAGEIDSTLPNLQAAYRAITGARH